ncbi:MAG: hypothetical protein VB108_10955 [Anaerolineaceae bacterium]|nr:hypothetical protein [Anaerolineaceae bacterium]
METQNAWPQIREALSANQPLMGLVDSCLATYEGVYSLSAPSEAFPALALSYPQLARTVFSLTQCPLRLQVDEASPSPQPEQTGCNPPARKGKGEGARPAKQVYVSRSAELQLRNGASTVTDTILQPESIAAVPSYLLRFIPYTGAAPVLVAIALRQAFYRFGKYRSAEQNYPKAGDKVSLEVERILAMLGGSISRASFFRLLKGGHLDWFAANLGSGHQVVNGQVKRLPNQYQYRGAVLTPGDASDLAAFLLAEGLPENPAKALALALETPRNQILKFPFRTPLTSDAPYAKALSVPELVRSLLPGTRMSPELMGLCDALSATLIRPESFLALPWYWFHKVLPVMGIDLGGLYLMARACGYTDWVSGQDRDRFWVSGGEATLQAWVGSKTLPRTLPAQKASAAGRPRQSRVLEQSTYVRNWRERARETAAPYLLRCDTRPGKANPKTSDWQLQVGPVGLTRQDETLRDALYAFLCAADAGGAALPAALQALKEHSGLQTALLAAARFSAKASQPAADGPEKADQGLQAGASKPSFGSGFRASTPAVFSTAADLWPAAEPLLPGPALICHFETLIQSGICHSETLNKEAICHFETLAQALNCYFETLIASGICQFETVIQILLRIRDFAFFRKDSSNTKNSLAEDTDQPESPALLKAAGEGENTEPRQFEALFTKIDPRKAAQIKARGLETSFAAWVIYGCMNEKIKDPLNLAVAKTLLGAQVPEPECLELAMLGEEELSEELAAYQLNQKRGYLGAEKWAPHQKGRLAEWLNENPGPKNLVKKLERINALLINPAWPGISAAGAEGKERVK